MVLKCPEVSEGHSLAQLRKPRKAMLPGWGGAWGGAWVESPLGSGEQAERGASALLRGCG